MHRFPAPLDRTASAIFGAVDAFAPLVMLGRPSRAHRLDDAAFHALDHALAHHANPYLRALWVLARFSPMAARYDDHAPEGPSDHPLDALLPRIRRSRAQTERTWDVVIIGSGAGGAPLAWALARAGRSVCIVEKGALVRPTTTDLAIERHYTSQGMVGSIAGMPLLFAGEAVGGTTVINSGTSFATPSHRLAAWDQQAGTRFVDDLPRYQQQALAHMGVRPSDRGVLDASAFIVERGLAALGHGESFVLPRNAPDCQGAGRCCFGCPNGAKQSTDRSYLPGAVEAGAALWWETTATEIRETSDGVEIVVRGEEGRRILRARTLVLAGGALATPHLVRSNRLGSAWKCAGDNLRIHPATKVFARMPDALPEGGVPQGLGFHTPRLPRLMFEGVHTPSSAAAPMISASGERHRWWMDQYPHLATFGVMARDRATGRIRGDGLSRLLDYRLHPDDARDIGSGVLLIADALFRAGADRVLLPLAVGEPEVESPAALARRSPEEFTPNTLMTSAFHPHGSAGVGRVVDPDLRLLGTDRIYISDASVLPDSPGVNPQVTNMGFAHRLAEHLGAPLEA
jgi:hypothetical protein